MANIKESDTLLWLHNKLGSKEPWGSGSLGSSQLNSDVLTKIRECFLELTTPIKLKLMLSFFHSPKRFLEESQREIEEIIEIAMADSEQWVSMLAEIMRPYATTGTLNLEILDSEDNKRTFDDFVNQVVAEIMRLESLEKDTKLYPMEFAYLNETALSDQVLSEPNFEEVHFLLKKKTKAAILREELLLKASEGVTSISKKISTPTMPLKFRGIPGNSPETSMLKPQKTWPDNSTAITSKLIRKSYARKESSVKLLDISEQPSNFGRNKRFKKQQDTAEGSKKSGTPKNSSSNTPTPEYAAGLVSSESTPKETPDVPPLKFSIQPTKHVQIAPYSQIASGDHASTSTTNVTSHLTVSSSSVSRGDAEIHVSNVLSSPEVKVKALTTVQSTTKTVFIHGKSGQLPSKSQVVSLSKELMEKAQEIFRTANVVTKPEKEFILRFMAGERGNLCPELGNIVTIKLSEHQEFIRQADGTVLPLTIETYFRMNYKSGEWEVIKKAPKVGTMKQEIIMQ